MRQPAGASAAARATAIAPVGGRGSGETETERDEGSETHSQGGARQMQTDRQTDRHERAGTHGEGETETGRHRATDREPENGRRKDRGQGMASAPRSTHWHRPWHTSERGRAEEAASLREGASAVGRRAPAGRSALGLAITRGDPKTSSHPRSQRSPSAWPPKARPSPRPQARG